jgi:VanZ family protein
MPQHDPYLAASQRLQSWLLVAYAALVLGASLYPFAFEFARLAEAAAAGFIDLRDWRVPTRRDLVVNLVAYLPLGLLAALALRARFPGAATRWLAATALGAALSLLVELLQHAIPVRVPSLADWVLNAASSAAGAALALMLGMVPSRPLAMRLRRLQLNPALALLVLLWLAAHTTPFLPRLRPGRIDSAIEASLALQPAIGAVAGYFAAWLILSAALRTLVRRDSFWSLFALVAVASLAARLLFVGQHLTPDECLGLLLALPVILRLRRRTHAASQTPLFGFVCVALLVLGLAPFSFQGVAGEFALQLVPSAGGGVADPYDFALLERLFLAIGAVWVAAGSAMGLGAGTLLLLLLTLATEAAQMWMPARTADASGVVLLLGGAVLVAVLRGLERQRTVMIPGRY